MLSGSIPRRRRHTASTILDRHGQHLVSSPVSIEIANGGAKLPTSYFRSGIRPFPFLFPWSGNERAFPAPSFPRGKCGKRRKNLHFQKKFRKFSTFLRAVPRFERCKRAIRGLPNGQILPPTILILGREWAHSPSYSPIAGIREEEWGSLGRDKG